ncbi:hypothetical protein NL676_001047 [Syzygium grande]|nr:hypothetical protein NL676_001047 [Syzygium grande]
MSASCDPPLNSSWYQWRSCRKVMVIVVIELVQGLVEGREIGVPSKGRAISPPGGSKARVDVGVVVDAGSKGVVVGQTNSIAPDRVVMSRALRPWVVEEEMRVARLEKGDGIWLLARLKLAILASHRRTVHDGPPNCDNNSSRISSYNLCT